MRLLVVFIFFIGNILFSQSDTTLIPEFEPIFGVGQRTIIFYHKDSIAKEWDYDPTILGVWELTKREDVDTTSTFIIGEKYRFEFTSDHLFKVYNDTLTHVIYWRFTEDTLKLYDLVYRNEPYLTERDTPLPIHVLKKNQLIIVWPEYYEEIQGERWVFRRGKRG